MNGKKPTGANGGAPDSVSARASSDPLASVRRVAEAMAGLRSETGRLDAGRVAEAFGLSVAELAGLVGKSRTSLSRIPDAMALQPSLRPFERTVRLRAVLSEADFLSWHPLEPSPRKSDAYRRHSRGAGGRRSEPRRGSPDGGARLKSVAGQARRAKRPFRGVGPGMLSPAGNWIIGRSGAAVKGRSAWR